MKKYYTIGQAANYLNISVETIRFYEKKGIIPQFIRDKNNYRLIDHRHLLFLKGVIQLKQAGFSLEEIKKINKDGFAIEAEQQYQILTQGIAKIQEQIDNLEKTKAKLSNDIAELKAFYSLVERDCFILKIEQKIEISELNTLTIDKILSEKDMYFALQGGELSASFCLLKAFLYKSEADAETVIKHMLQFCKDNNLAIDGTILLKVISAPSYYTGDALAAIIYIALEGEYGNKIGF